MKELEATRQAVLNEGEIYHVKKGGMFRCLQAFPNGDAVLMSIMSRYRFTAYGVTLYADGTISWDRSSDGTFV